MFIYAKLSVLVMQRVEALEQPGSAAPRPATEPNGLKCRIDSTLTWMKSRAQVIIYRHCTSGVQITPEAYP
jgi:hypothetical protein